MKTPVKPQATCPSEQAAAIDKKLEAPTTAPALSPLLWKASQILHMATEWLCLQFSNSYLTSYKPGSDFSPLTASFPLSSRCISAQCQERAELTHLQQPLSFVVRGTVTARRVSIPLAALFYVQKNHIQHAAWEGKLSKRGNRGCHVAAMQSQAQCGKQAAGKLSTAGLESVTQCLCSRFIHREQFGEA